MDIYADEGVTGTSAQKRQDFQRLLSDCRRGLIDKVLVKSISRFARNTKDCLEAIRELKALGVSVCFEEQNIDTAAMSGEMMTALFASFAQAESESISGNMRWSYQKRMQSGTFIPSSLPFGYKLEDGKITIDAEQAGFVRQIFSDYLSGCNTIEIADKLQKQRETDTVLQVQNWRFQDIARILKNEKYTGDSLWQKTYRSDTLPRKVIHNQGERDQYYAMGTHPAIIEREVFEQAQQIKQRQTMLPSKKTTASPWSHVLICGNCGGYLRKKEVRSQNYRLCRQHEADRTSCHISQMPETVAEQGFLRLYHKLKHHGLPILTELAASLRQMRERRMLWSMDVIEINKRIASITSQEQRLTELKKHGLVDPDIFISQLNELATQLREAKLEKERFMEAEDDTALVRTQELIEVIENGPDFIEAFDEALFGELVDKVIVESNERLRFRLKNGLELAEAIERTVR